MTSNNTLERTVGNVRVSCGECRSLISRTSWSAAQLGRYMTMMRAIAVLITVSTCWSCATGPSSTSATSPTSPTSRSGTNYFDCDVPSGKFSRWTQTGSPIGPTITGTLNLIEVRPGPSWLPVASVGILGSERKTYVGLRARVNPASPDQLEFVLVSSQSPRERPAFAVAPARLKVAFSLVIDELGHVSADVDGRSDRLILEGFVAKEFELSCSSAQFKFETVRFN